jgi:hypothetical protein
VLFKEALGVALTIFRKQIRWKFFSYHSYCNRKFTETSIYLEKTMAYKWDPDMWILFVAILC